MKALNPINKKKWTLIFVLSHLYDIGITLLFAYGLNMGIYQEANPYVRLMLSNKYYYQFFIMELFILIGLITTYRWIIKQHNLKTRLLQYELKVSNERNINQFIIASALGIIKGIIFYIPFRFIFGGSTWAMAYFGII